MPLPENTIATLMKKTRERQISARSTIKQMSDAEKGSKRTIVPGWREIRAADARQRAMRIHEINQRRIQLRRQAMHQPKSARPSSNLPRANAKSIRDRLRHTPRPKPVVREKAGAHWWTNYKSSATRRREKAQADAAKAAKAADAAKAAKATKAAEAAKAAKVAKAAEAAKADDDKVAKADDYKVAKADDDKDA